MDKVVEEAYEAVFIIEPSVQPELELSTEAVLASFTLPEKFVPAIPNFRQPTLENPIFIPPIKFSEGTTFGVGAGSISEVGSFSSAAKQGKDLAVRTYFNSPEHDKSFADVVRMDSMLLHLSELNHTVS